MNGPLLIVGVVLAIILAFLVYRSLKGPKVAQVNPFDAVEPLRAPQFPDSVGQPSAAAAANSEQSASEADSEHQEEATEPEEDMTIAAYIAQAEEQEKDADFDQAIDSISEAIALAQVEFGGDSVEVAQLLIKQGQLFQLRDYEEAADEIDCAEYLQALAILQQHFGGKSEELLPVLKLLISWYYQTGDLQKADTLIRRCGDISEAASEAKRLVADRADQAAPVAKKISPFKVPFTSSDSAAVESCKEGDEAFAAGEYDDAVTAFEAAIESVQVEVGRAAPELAQLFHRLGRVLQVKDAGDTDDEGNAYTDPADNMQIALSMLVKIHGFDAVELSPLLLDLAAFEDQRGDHYKAESYLRRLDMLERVARNAENARKARQQ
jgi:hypothetical protein